MVTFVDQDQHTRCTVVMVTYNNAREIDEALTSLRAAADGVTMRVVAVDNASSDGTCAVVRSRHPDVEVVETGRNGGFAAGINTGITAGGDALARTDAVLVMNADVRFAPDAVTRMLAVLDDPDVAAVVPRLLDADGRVSRSIRREPSVLRTLGDALLGAHWPDRPAALGEIVYDPAVYGVDGDVEWATGAATLVRATAWRTAGPWDEAFFMYGEETDYARRLRANGGRVRYCSAAVVVHEGAASGTSEPLANLLVVNRVRYATKHHGPVRAAGVRLALILGSVLRVRRPGSRSRLHALASRSQWSTLPGAGLSA